jgi:hypothetical protein
VAGGKGEDHGGEATTKRKHGAILASGIAAAGVEAPANAEDVAPSASSACEPACRLPMKAMKPWPIRAEAALHPGRALALAASLAIHAGVLALVAFHFHAEGGARRADAALVRLVLPAGTLVPAPDDNGPLPPHSLSAGTRLFPTGCRGATYTGIGARVNGAGFIVDLAAGGPAERAGLRPGDAILNLEDLPIDVYPAGQPVGLRLLRDGLETAAIVRIGAICNEPPATVA